VTSQAPIYAYRPEFLAPEEAGELYRTLLHGVCWQQEWLQLYGRRTPVPRLLSWCGDEGVNYRYSGADHVCRGWLPELGELRRRLMVVLGISSNLVLMNRYRCGSDYMGWHADDERGLAAGVASVSLGAKRRFLLRLPGCERSEGLDLDHGSLLVMDGTVHHALPRTRRAIGERISLTFRLLETPSR
jgi:alkylated DNA repair dioxygenase AlkB